MMWKPVVGFEDRYEVSDSGEVRAIDRPGIRGNRGPKVLRQRTHEDGYKIVGLWRDYKKTLRKVHQLVLEAFIGPRPIGMISCHNNGVPHDNKIENLRWDTPSENMLDRTRHGRFIKHSDQCIKEMVQLNNNNMPRGQISNITGLSESYISRVLLGKIRKETLLMVDRKNASNTGPICIRF